MQEKTLSVIVPAYKQEKTIIEDLRNIDSALKQIRYDYEIICVVDGRVDRTFERAKKIRSPKIKVIGYEQNRGKGYAVRYGMARAKGDLVAFIDAGMDINPNGIPLLLEHMKWYNSDVIVGSIRHSASKIIGYPLKRRVFSIGYHLLTRFLFGLRITDSQRGIKIFKREVLEKVLPRLIVKRFAFDIEMLAVSYRFGFRRIHDGPVEMDARRFRYSSIKASTVFEMLIDTLIAFYRLKFLHYYDARNKRHWVNDKDLDMGISIPWGKLIKVSVIIPVRTITPYVRETVSFLKKQTKKNFEIIVVTDKKESLKSVTIIPSGEPTPAFKRNLGAKVAKGEILAFLDDDSYPEANWLKNALEIFGDKEVVGVCGPSLTPPTDNIFQKASGLVWASWLGSGGAGVYRNRLMPRRKVDDFPSVNLLIRKKDFEEVGGFDINHWPGEDTKLCLDLIQLGKKIIYDPKVLVYHHRRAVFLPHLKQISRYALRRGHFAKIFPETSFKSGYLFPSLFAYGLLLGGIFTIFFPFIRFPFYFLFSIYYLLLLLSTVEVLIKERNLDLAILTMEAIFMTHLVYGLLFPFGYFQKNLKTVPHEIDLEKKVYVGG